MATPPPRQNHKHERERKPFQQLRTNPFACRNNYNFPGLENAFDSTKKTSPDRQSSVLDISIGAHAAINEQTRHVAHFGLDGTKTAKAPHGWSGDYEWDHLLDETNVSHVSTYVTDIEPNVMHPGQSFVSQLRNNASVLDENEPLDMTFDQSDFFSSSRVGILTTPEKNKPKVDEASRLARLGGGMAEKRGKENSDPNYSESISGSTDASVDFNGSGMLGFFNAALQLENEGQQCENDDDGNDDGQDSFITYQDPDLSILSTRNSRSTGKSSGEKTNNFFPDDAQSSFISYAEPDLSILSNGLIESKSDDIGSLGRHVSSPTASTFCADTEELFFNMKKYSKSSPKSDFGHSDFEADMSEIIAPSDFQQRQHDASPDSMVTNGCLVPGTQERNDQDDSRFSFQQRQHDASPDSMAINGCLVPATQEDNDQDDNRFRLDQDTRFVSTTVRNITMNSHNQLFMEKSPCTTPQRTVYSTEADIANNLSGVGSAGWYASSPDEGEYPEKITAENPTSSDKIKLRNNTQRPTMNQNLGTADEKDELTPRSSPIKEARTPSTSKSFFLGLSPISNHVRGYSNDDDGNESPISVNKSLFFTTLTEIQTQLSSEGALMSHLQTASSAETFHANSLDAPKDVPGRHPDETSLKNNGYSQKLPRRSGLAERYSRPDRFEDSFSAVIMGVRTSNRDPGSNLDKFHEDYYISKSSEEAFEVDYHTRR